MGTCVLVGSEMRSAALVARAADGRPGAVRRWIESSNHYTYARSSRAASKARRCVGPEQVGESCCEPRTRPP
jgi:hypothetical protein